MQSEKKEPKKHVTNRQGSHLAKLARENNVTREEFSSFLKDEEKTKIFFDGLKPAEKVWFEKLQISAQTAGLRVHFSSKVIVDYTRPLYEAAQEGGPNTESDSEAYLEELFGTVEGEGFRDTDEEYLERSPEDLSEELLLEIRNSLGVAVARYPKYAVIEEIVFFVDPCDKSFEEIEKWASLNALRKTTSHVPFAVGKEFPELNDKFRVQKMCVVETSGITEGEEFSLCSLQYYGEKSRRAECYSEYEYRAGTSFFDKHDLGKVFFLFRK